ARNVRGHFHLVRQAHAGHLAKRRVRLLRRGGVDAHADATALRAGHERRRRRLATLRLAAEFYELVDRWHCVRKTSSLQGRHGPLPGRPRAQEGGIIGVDRALSTTTEPLPLLLVLLGGNDRFGGRREGPQQLPGEDP